MPPKNWGAIRNIMDRRRQRDNQQPPQQPQQQPQQPVQQPGPQAPQVRGNRQQVRRALEEPRGRIRGQNGHLLQSVSWVFTLRLSQVPQSINFVDPNGRNQNDYVIPPLQAIQARFNNVFNAPRGHPPVYISYQLELGNNGDPMFGDHYHLQGYIEFEDAVTATEIVEMMGFNDQDPAGWWNWDMADIYLAPRIWSQQAAQQYTHKEDTVVTEDDGEGGEFIRLRVEEGQMRNQQGNVWEDMVRMVNNGANYDEICDAYPRHALIAASGLTKKILERLKRNPPAWRDVKVYIFWGDTRTGKTRKVYELEGYDRVYSKTDDSTNFDGYDPNKHKVLLLDESYGNYPHGKFLHWLQGHPHLLNQKFGGCWANWEKVYITSNVAPRLWYGGKIPVSQQKALYKRYKTGGIVKFVNSNDPESVREHNDEVAHNLNKDDRQYVVFSAVPDD